MLGIVPGTILFGSNIEVGVADSTNIQRGGGTFWGPRYLLPGSIPPHALRALRVLWISNTCLGPGISTGIDQLILRVRVGLFGRTEVVSLRGTWYLSGPSQPAQPGGYCG